MAVAARKYAEAVDVMAFEEVAGYAKGLQHFHRSPAQKAAAQRIAASRLSFNDNGFNARIQQVHRRRRARGTAADDPRIRSTHSRNGKSRFTRAPPLRQALPRLDLHSPGRTARAILAWPSTRTH